MIEFLLSSSRRGPIKSIATELPCWSGIGNGCKGPYSFMVEDLFHWQSGQDTMYPPNFEVVGAKLNAMMQALLYQDILEWEKVPQRRGTTICLDMTRHAVQDLSGFLPSDSRIWYSLRNKDISRNICAYMWKCMHNTLQCGAYWLNILGYEQRAMCRVCSCNELLEHILTECQASGQETVWMLANELLMKKGISLTAKPTFGQTLGCGLANIRDRRGKTLKGSSRLYTIVVSESTYLIWRLRCEWRIE